MTDATLQLLTAFVDGELSADEQAKVVNYLKRSAEARRLVGQLQNDAALLRGLPVEAVATDVAAAGILRGERLKAERALSRSRRRASRSVGLAVASLGSGVSQRPAM